MKKARRGGTRVSRELETNLAWISFYLSSAMPRIIKPGRDLPPVVIYTDGAYEPAEGSKSSKRGLATKAPVPHGMLHGPQTPEPEQRCIGGLVASLPCRRGRLVCHLVQA